MRPRSFRARLTLWNVAVLALAICGLVAAVLHFTWVQQDLARDRELLARARFFEMFAYFPPPGSSPGGPSAPPSQSARPQPRSGAAAPDRRSAPVRPRAGRPNGPTRRTSGAWSNNAIPFDRYSERYNWFRSPRFLDYAGRLMAPPGMTPWDAAAVRPAIAGRLVYTYSDSREERIRVLSYPVRREGKAAGAIQIAAELGEVKRQRAEQLKIVLALAPLALLVAGLGGLFLANRALAPVAAVTEAAAQIGEQDLSRRLAVRGGDELARLAVTFNQMIERLEGAFRDKTQAFERLERAYEQQKRFTGDASHELRTPLTRIKTSTSAALQQGETIEEFRQALEVADRAADTMARLVDQLLMLARADAGQLTPVREPVDLAAVLADAVDLAGCGANVSLDLPAEPVVVLGDESLLLRVFINLIENAVRYTAADGGITASAREEEGRAVACVADTGCGIAPEHLPRLFERFYRVDTHRSRDAGGTGLGLAICRSIVDAHKGDIGIESEIGVGTRVTVTLPLGPPPSG